MVRLQNRIAVGLEVLQFFTSTEWDFRSDNFKGIKNVLTSAEREMQVKNLKLIEGKSEIFLFRFLMDTTQIADPREHLKNMLLGGRVYCMKEPLSTLPKARRQIKM